ncbi:EF-hand domain-containing protein [Parvibaculum sp.]|uniref:EF-hand domain-containing protein n=1 Tax=Parvibaculum sp. TaxID=2024848 RepID=UPI00391BFFAC
MKKLKYGLLGTAAALAMAMTIPALSHAGPGKYGHGAHLFGMADADKGGDVTKEEFRAAAEARFATMDKDGDGYVTKEEMAAARAEMRTRYEARRGDPAERFAAMDADGDGKVTLDEMKQAAEKRMAERGREGGLSDRSAERMAALFEKADANSDGALTLEEMQAAKKHHGKTDAKRDGKKDGKRGDHFSRLDADGDGRISKAEFLASADRMFERLDRNSDGKIERGEGRMSR